MYISLLQRNKKSRKSIPFKRKVVEVFRAEIAQPADIKCHLHISQTELRKLNRWYFKHRLAPYLYPHRCYKSMKKHNQDAYVKALERRMTESGDPNENAIAERVFRTLKEEFKLRGFPRFVSAEAAVEQAISAYNSIRPHASLAYQTPNQAHQQRGYRNLKWYPYKKVRYGNVQYKAESQPYSPL